jgi:hypothetical protein
VLHFFDGNNPTLATQQIKSGAFFQCWPQFPNSFHEISWSDLPSELISYIMKYREKSDLDKVFESIISLFNSGTFQIVKSQDWVQIFQLISPLLDRTRVSFMKDILNILLIMLQSSSESLSYYSITNQNEFLILPEIKDLTSPKSFTFCIDIQLLFPSTNGMLINYPSDKSEIFSFKIIWRFPIMMIHKKLINFFPPTSRIFWYLFSKKYLFRFINQVYW